MIPETIEALKKRMAEPCLNCTKETFKYLMDPQVQVLMEPWLKERDSMLQLHVHSDALTKHNAGILFLMAIHITEEIQILYFTPASTTVEGAFEVLKEVVEREKKRCSPATGGADDVGRRAKKKERKTRGASEVDDRGAKDGTGDSVQSVTSS